MNPSSRPASHNSSPITPKSKKRASSLISPSDQENTPKRDRAGSDFAPGTYPHVTMDGDLFAFQNLVNQGQLHPTNEDLVQSQRFDETFDLSRIGDNEVSSDGNSEPESLNFNFDPLDDDLNLPVSEPRSSTLIEQSLIEDPESTMIDIVPIAFLPCGGKYYLEKLRTKIPLDRPDYEGLAELINEQVSNVNDENHATIAKKEFIPKTMLDSLGQFLGTPLCIADLINDSKNVFFNQENIFSQDDFRALQTQAKNQGTKILNGISKLASTRPASAAPSKSQWLRAIHTIASRGMKIIVNIKQSAWPQIVKMKSERDRRICREELTEILKCLEKITQIYTCCRILSEMYLSDPTVIIAFVPAVSHEFIWQLIVEDIVKDGFPQQAKLPIHKSNAMIEERLRESGVRIHSSTKSGRKILGVSQSFINHSEKSRPLIGHVKKVSHFVMSGDEFDLVKKFVESSLCRYSRIEPTAEALKRELEKPCKNSLLFLVHLMKESIANKSFLEQFAKRNVTFGPEGKYTNRIFRLQNPDEETEPAKPTKPKPPSWAKNPSNFIPRLIMKESGLNPENYRLEKKKNACVELPRNNRYLELNPVSQSSTPGSQQPSQPDRTVCANVKALAAEMQELLLKDISPSSKKYKTLSRKIKKLSVTADPDSISLLKSICHNMNLMESKKVSKEIIVMSLNMGRITDPEKLRLLINMFPKVSIFLFSEVMWEIDEVNRKTNWPPSFRLFCHKQLGKSNLAYSFIAWNTERVKNVEQLDSVGTFTVGKITKKGSKSCILATGYRFNDNAANCWYKKNLGSLPTKFCDWVDQLADLYNKDCYRFFLCGDWNIEDLPRTGDPKEIALRLSSKLRTMTNLIFLPTFFRDNCRASSIDKVYTNCPNGTRIKYLNLHKPPHNHDGHCGVHFQIGIEEEPVFHEVFVCSKLKSRREIFESAMKLEASLEGNTYENHFNLLSKILENNTVKTVSIKVPKSRNDFNYSKATWLFINFQNDLKESLSKETISSNLGRKTLSILAIKIKTLMKIE